MKKIYSILLSALVCASLVSCEDFLRREPVSSLTQDNFWRNEKDAEVGVTAIFSTFAKAMTFGIWDWGEVRGDTYYPYEKGAVFQTQLIGNYIQIDNQAARWTELYNVIGKANAAIKYIPRISMTASKKNHLLAEAYAMRAWAYFYCVRVWGDVPYYVDPIEDADEDVYRPRTDKDVIMNEIILPDLERALYLIDRSNTSRIRMNIATLHALTMDVYAWLHDYEAVIRIMEERVSALSSTNWGLLSLNSTTFVNGWRAMFIEDNAVAIPKEVLFKVAYDRYGVGENYAMRYFGTASAYVTLSDKVRGIFDAADKRSGSTQWEVHSGSLYLLRKKFWPDGTDFTSSNRPDSDNDIVMYRYADMVLLYAEALNEVDKKNDAITELNKTRTRAGNTAYTAANFTDKEQLLDAIVDERHKEFLGEGKRWFDLVRTNRWRQIMEPINGMNDPRHVLFPVHRDHLVQNHRITQNPGYATP